MKITIPHGAQRIISTLHADGFEAVIVGGCVRDHLLGRTPGDYDIATSATPEEVISTFKGFTVVPTGVQHGTVTVVISGTNYEVTTYRIDGDYADGRRPDNVTFTPSLYEDLKRRDFTVNAFAYSNETGLVDHFNGTDDLTARTIRCVGNPNQRFAEDYLRMLRAFRFAAVLDFTIDEETLAAIHTTKHRITAISAERIRMELDKLLLSSNFPVIQQFLNEFAEIILPEAMPDMAVLQRAENALCQRIAALFHNCPNTEKTAVITLRRLKYDNATIDLTCAIITSRHANFIPNKPTMKRLLRDFGNHTKRCIAYFAASNPEKSDIAAKCLEITSQIIENNEPYTIAHLDINGTDVIAAGIPPGREVGNTLAFLLEKVIDEPALNCKQALLKLVPK